MNIQQIKTEILSGLTISIALVPEAISFALLVGVAPQIGLWAAVFMALSTALFGGRPGLISGATGATAVIMAGLVTKAGVDHLFLGVMVAGIIQLIFWATDLWKVFTRIPHSAISGFLLALAVMILLSQFEYLEVGSPTDHALVILIAVAILCSVVMLISSKLFSFPPALSAILIGTLIGIPLGFATVGDLSPVSASLPSFKVPDFTVDKVLLVLPFSFGMAVSGLTESLLTVDSISHKLNEHGDKGRETFAQGLGNIASSVFGTMGGCVLVGQTNLNISAGAKHRLSGLVAALGLVIIILVFGKYIEKLPLVGLIGVMLVVVYETGDWRSLTTKNYRNLGVVIATVASSLLSSNLAIGVIIGSTVFYISKLALRYDSNKK